VETLSGAGGTRLAYHQAGEGDPLICLPGGPAGEYDVGLPPKCAAEYAGPFGQAELAVQPGGGHYPWLDNPQRLVQTLSEFLP
jgi:pimeloyl-ACP methyl ester carboxylesterase